MKADVFDIDDPVTNRSQRAPRVARFELDVVGADVADVVACDHHREELGEVLRDALAVRSSEAYKRDMKAADAYIAKAAAAAAVATGGSDGE